jgi:energy-coupling factor transport system ATP-binding protein
LSSPNSRSFSSVPSIRVSNLTYTYEGTTHPALYNINLIVKSGEFVIIAGPSGSGKSTLARCLTGFIPNEFPGHFQGTITVESLNTQTHPIRRLARSISLIQQDPDSQLVTLQVTNEVAFGLENFQNPPDLIQSKIHWPQNSKHATERDHKKFSKWSGGVFLIGCGMMLLADFIDRASRLQHTKGRANRCASYYADQS